MAAIDLYEGRDPRDIPAYSFREVALSIGVPASTVRAWCLGQSNFKSLLGLPAQWSHYHALSFFNLIEMQVIAELRREHKVSMSRVREALRFLAKNVPVRHPLVESELYVTPNQRVYIVHAGRHIDISAGGQWPLDAVIRNLLRRVHRGRNGILAFFPRVTPPKGTSLEAGFRPTSSQTVISAVIRRGRWRRTTISPKSRLRPRSGSSASSNLTQLDPRA